MLVQHFLENSAAKDEAKVALLCEGRRLSYGEVETMANRLANALIEHGVRRGDRVGIFLNNSIAAVAGIFAVLKAGAVFVPIHHTTKHDKLAYVLKNCRATALLTDARGAAQCCLPKLQVEVPSLRFFVACGSESAEVARANRCCLDFTFVQKQFPDLRPRRVNIDLDLACLIYTSGSTGDPKGVMSDHRNVDFAASSIIQYLENVSEDIVLSVLPLSFDYGLYQLLMTFKFGGTLVLENSFAFPSVIMQQAAQERATGFPGVPTIFAILARMDLTGFDLSALRYLTNTAAALPPSHIEELLRKFPGTKIFSMYGLTETKRTLYLPPAELQRKPGSVGIAIPGTEVWVENEEGKRLGANEVGELVVRGQHVMRGYWEAPEATAQRFRPGPIPGERLCHTGDLFQMDDEGYMYFVGRKDDIIKSRGEKVAPKEIENVLYALAGVVEAAVVGVPDPILGQAIKAMIVVKENHLSHAQVLAHCRAHLEDYMIPKYVEFRNELPKTSSGKIKKTGLG